MTGLKVEEVNVHVQGVDTENQNSSENTEKIIMMKVTMLNL